MFEEIIAKNFPTMGKEILNQVQESTGSSWQDKPKEKHTKPHGNQTGQKLKTRLNIKSNKGKKITQHKKELPLGYQLIS